MIVLRLSDGRLATFGRPTEDEEDTATFARRKGQKNRKQRKDKGRKRGGKGGGLRAMLGGKKKKKGLSKGAKIGLGVAGAAGLAGLGVLAAKKLGKKRPITAGGQRYDAMSSRMFPPGHD